MSYTVAKGNQRVDPDQVAEAGKIPEGVVDLRSDTVTRPTPEMRRAMVEAEVGDDVYGEDPTVNRLEKRAAEIFGKEAALFVPTGCMGNLIAIKVWTHHGNEVICEERSHVNLYELASMSAIAGCMPRVARGEDGILTWPQIEAVIRPTIYYDSQTALVCLENSHNMAGGTLYTANQITDICERAHAAGLKVHLDGARVFNAAVALGVEVAEMASNLDSVMFCLSKGLGAPVGSMVVGAHGFIEKARILMSTRKASSALWKCCERWPQNLKEPRHPPPDNKPLGITLSLLSYSCFFHEKLTHEATWTSTLPMNSNNSAAAFANLPKAKSRLTSWSGMKSRTFPWKSCPSSRRWAFSASFSPSSMAAPASATSNMPPPSKKSLASTAPLA